MEQKTDVFVVGGGPAGLAAAIAARQRGFSVVVADGAEPPIDKACGEGLMPDTLAVLRELGVRVNSGQGFAFQGIRFVGDDAQVDASFPFGEGIGMRRPVLHQMMIERAEQLGVKCLWRTSVTNLSAGGVVAGGKNFAARWIVGADGIRSRVRRWSGLEASTRARSRYGFRRHYRVAPWTNCMEIYWGPNAQAYVTPVSSRDVCIAVISQNPATRSDSIISRFPKVAERLLGAESSGESGAVTLTSGLPAVHRGRVALIGDASGSVDAITGEGLSLSFHQAVALADALEAGDLGQYQIAHRRLARRPTLMARLLLLLGSHSGLRRRALRVLEAHPEIFERMLAIHVGATSPAHLAATGALLGWRFVAA